MTFAFNEAVGSFAVADITAVGTLSKLQQTDATHYTATFTGADNTDISNASVNVTAGSYHRFAKSDRTDGEAGELCWSTMTDQNQRNTEKAEMRVMWIMTAMIVLIILGMMDMNMLTHPDWMHGG